MSTWLPAMGVMLMSLSADASAFEGPLRVCPDNPRYFTDDSGRAIYLTGSHTWATLQERAGEDTPVDMANIVARDVHTMIGEL